MAVYGEYNHLAWAFMEKRDATPHIEEGDMEILKNGHPDFIGFNYYSTATVAWCDEKPRRKHLDMINKKHVWKKVFI